MILDESKLDREGFEKAYAAMQSEKYPRQPSFEAFECAELRGQHGDYRDFSFMHGCWIGWCLAQKAN